MGFMDSLRNWWDPGAGVRGAAANVQMPYFQEDRDRLGGLLQGGSPYGTAAQVGQSGYAGDNRALVTQLQNQAAGRGPSLAQQTYRNAAQDTTANLAALGHTGGYAGARNAAIQQGRVGQGMAQGVAQARTAEQLGALGQLQGALGMAGQSEFNRDALNAQLQQQTGSQNQQAYLDILGKQLGLSSEQLRALIGQGQLQLGAAGLPNGIDKLLNLGASVGGLLAGKGGK